MQRNGYNDVLFCFVHTPANSARMGGLTDFVLDAARSAGIDTPEQPDLESLTSRNPSYNPSVLPRVSDFARYSSFATGASSYIRRVRLPVMIAPAFNHIEDLIHAETPLSGASLINVQKVANETVALDVIGLVGAFVTDFTNIADLIDIAPISPIEDKSKYPQRSVGMFLLDITRIL